MTVGILATALRVASQCHDRRESRISLSVILVIRRDLNHFPHGHGVLLNFELPIMVVRRQFP